MMKVLNENKHEAQEAGITDFLIMPAAYVVKLMSHCSTTEYKIFSSEN